MQSLEAKKSPDSTSGLKARASLVDHALGRRLPAHRRTTIPLRPRVRETVPNRAGTSGTGFAIATQRSEEHTSELQSHVNLVCRLLLEKKNKNAHWESALTI